MYLCWAELFSIEQIIYIKMDLALNNLQRLICHKTKQTKPELLHITAWIVWNRNVFDNLTVLMLNWIVLNHHHYVVLLARISLTLSCHFSLSFIAPDWSSGLHPVSSHSCCMYVRAGRPAFAWPYVGVHRNTSLMSSSLLLQQCPACLVRLAWIVFVMGGRWLYSWFLVGCCCQDLFK